MSHCIFRSIPFQCIKIIFLKVQMKLSGTVFSFISYIVCNEICKTSLQCRNVFGEVPRQSPTRNQIRMLFDTHERVKSFLLESFFSYMVIKYSKLTTETVKLKRKIIYTNFKSSEKENLSFIVSH